MWELVSFEATDGVLLHGALSSLGNKKVVLHVHGMAGNFYSSCYHSLMAQRYSYLGFDYLTFNNRGAEYIKKLKNVKTGESTYYGFAYEVFEESERDIIGAINFLKGKGYEEIVLQGHSSGAQKIIYTVSKNSLRVKGIVLLSPCDDVGLAIKQYGEDGMRQKLKFAEEFKKRHPKTRLLPRDFFFGLPISTQTFLNHYGPSSKFNIFHYYDLSKPFGELKANKNPTLVVFGENDYVLDFGVVERVYSQFSNYTLRIIPNADHKYKGYETELVQVICEFLADR